MYLRVLQSDDEYLEYEYTKEVYSELSELFSFKTWILGNWYFAEHKYLIDQAVEAYYQAVSESPQNSPVEKNEEKSE